MARRESTAFELVLKSTEAAQRSPGVRTRAADAGDAGAADARAADAVPGYSGGGPRGGARDRGCRWACCLSRSGRRRLSLNRRRAEVLEAVEGSTLKGEAGRALLNDSQREMNTITRMLSNMSKRYVVVRGAADDDERKRRRRSGSSAAAEAEEEVAVIEESLMTRRRAAVSTRSRLPEGGR